MKCRQRRIKRNGVSRKKRESDQEGMKIAATVLRTLEKNRLGYYYVIYYM
jgi:hypothetical protein